jgi:GT2 family glycosyltransferase
MTYNSVINRANEPDQQESKRIIIADIQSKPATITSSSFNQEITIKIDEISVTKDRIMIWGWSTDKAVKLKVVTTTEVIPTSTKFVERADINAYVAQGLENRATGFVISGELSLKNAHSKLYVAFNFEDKLYISAINVKRESSNAENLGELTLTNSEKSKAHIDLCGAILGKFGVLSGWAISKPGVTLWLADSRGNKKPLSSTLRFHRDDISAIFGSEYSSATVYSGFVSDWPYPQSSADFIAIIEQELETFKLVALSKWTAIADDPISYARFSFSVPTPAQDFDLRLNQWEGLAINRLIEERRSQNELNDIPATVWEFGVSNLDDLTTSIIIPLYGRWDFVEHQLSEFSKDAAFRSTTEIIYVIDDPLLITPIINEAENLLRLYGVAFKLIWGNRNRGFSGANNLGVQHARGEFLILLNSDVFPTRTGWVEAICSPLIEREEYGIIGAKLLFPDGGLQHGGMTFLFSQSWGVWLNKHPWAGLDPNFDMSTELVEKPAVTGACMAMRKSDYVRLGGFDEGYLIGDFEDSDLCMKVREAGLKIGYLPNIVLTHLERQSFSLLGDSSFRTLVVRFNAWRHSKKWSASIQKTMNGFKGLTNE